MAASSDKAFYLMQPHYVRLIMRRIIEGKHHYDDIVINKHEDLASRAALIWLLRQRYVSSGFDFKLVGKHGYYLPTVAGHEWMRTWETKNTSQP